MKKVFALALFAVASLMLVSPIMAATVVPLFAAKDIDVGTVTATIGAPGSVTYDTTTTSSGGLGLWWIIRTRTHVDADLLLIPHTQKGNLIPGEFEDVSPDLAPTQSYAVSIDVVAGDWVAAHAKVRLQDSVAGVPLWEADGTTPKWVNLESDPTADPIYVEESAWGATAVGETRYRDDGKGNWGTVFPVEAE
ncbi:hypothetical protein ACFL6S_35070 [Candidatus Poribacteria bacterium]